jgi:hypothetical protein
VPIHNGRFLTGARLVLTALREMRSLHTGEHDTSLCAPPGVKRIWRARESGLYSSDGGGVLGRKFLEIDPTAFCGRPEPQETRLHHRAPRGAPRRNPAHDWLSLSPFARASARISTRAAQSGRQYRIQEWLPFGTVLRRGQLCYRRLSSLNDRYEGIEVD